MESKKNFLSTPTLSKERVKMSPRSGKTMRKTMCAILPVLAGALTLTAAEVPTLTKTMPAVKKSYFQRAKIEVSDTIVESPFSAAPKVGVHPRILISPEDLPALRKQLKDTACGRRAIAAIRSWVHNVALKNDAPLGGVFSALAAGEAEALSATTNSWWRNNTGVTLCLMAFDAMIKDDQAKAQTVARALVTYAQIAGGMISPHGHTSINPDTSLGYAYDFLYNYMTAEQQAIIRKVIAQATKGKKSHGMDMAPEDRTYNWMPHGMNLVLLALAIEGEEGYDPNIYPASVEVMKDFLTYGIYPDGVPRECMHYFNFGMSTGAPALVAMARRGDNLFGAPFYNRLKNWYIHSIEPFGYAFSMHGDTSNDYGGLLPNYVLMKKVFPDDPAIEFAWRNRICDNYTGLTYRGDFLFTALFGSDWQGGANTEKAPLADQWGVDNNGDKQAQVAPQTWKPTSLNPSTSLFSPYRGFMIARTGWNKDAMVMHFECRRDALGPGHNHSNQNDFTLSALGRKWVIERGFAICETKHHSCILIDGKGQGCFAAPGMITAYMESPIASFSTGDASYAYTYRHTFPGRTGNKGNRGFNWEKSPISDAARALDNPVLHAYRTAMLVKGKYPYALILDNIQKDDKEHVYDWLMQVPDDLVLKKASATQAILAEQNATGDSPELLVEILNQNQTVDNTLSDAVEPLRLETFRPRRSPNSGGNKVFKMGKKLVLSSRSVAPEYKIMLYPYRPGSQMAKVERKSATYSVTFPGQNDVYHFYKQANGQEGFSLNRNDGDTILVSGLATYTSPDLSFSTEAADSPLNIAIQGHTLTVSGTGWKSASLQCREIKTILSDGSIAEIIPTKDGYKLSEKLAAPQKN
jgi:hypothetical protein